MPFLAVQVLLLLVPEAVPKEVGTAGYSCPNSVGRFAVSLLSGGESLTVTSCCRYRQVTTLEFTARTQEPQSPGKPADQRVVPWHPRTP